MKIINKGKWRDGGDIEHTCHKCHCVFLFWKKEAEVRHDRYGEVLQIKCPMCQEINWSRNV